MFKKLLLSFLASLVLLTSVSVPTVRAQTWYNQGFYEWYTKVYDTNISPSDQIFGERYTAAQIQWIIYSVPAVLVNHFVEPELAVCVLGVVFGEGVDVNSCFSLVSSLLSEFISYDESNQHYAQEGGFGTILKKIATEDRSLSGFSYVRNRLEKLNLIPEAHAQGFGFTSALNPFQLAWSASRNIVYSLFVIATIIMAFMIMFRVKLSPQTVVTVQSAIPKLVIALILVTFSYAIAGFLVDLMYVAIGIVSLILTQVINGVLGTNVQASLAFTLMTRGPWMGGAINLGIWGLVIVYIVLFAIIALLCVMTAIGIVGAIAILARGIGGPLLAIFLIVLFLFAVVSLLISTFKTIWMLIKTFINIILLTIFSPFQILIGLFIPGFGFGAWLKSFASNLAVFVATGALFILSYLFLFQAAAAALDSFDESIARSLANLLIGTAATDIVTGTASPGWPPLLSPTDSFLSFLYLGVSFVVFSLPPKAAEMIKSFMSGRPFSYGTAVGEAISQPLVYVGRGVGVATDEDVGKRWGRLTKSLGIGRPPSPPSPPSPYLG